MTEPKWEPQVATRYLPRNMVAGHVTKGPAAAMSVREQLFYWSVAGLVAIALLWLLADALLPFVTGAALAYFLNPVATRLTRLGLPRPLAVTAVVLVLIGLFSLAMVLLIPTLITQIIQFTEIAPDLFNDLRKTLAANFPEVRAFEQPLERALAGLGETIQERGAELAQGAMRSVSGFASALFFIVITPVVAFYLLLDWPRVVSSTRDLLPREHAPVIRDLAGQIDRTIAGFVRGQVTVCLILALYYATLLWLAGLQFGLAIGVMAGLISFIPFIGAIIGGALAIGVALWQFWGEPLSIAIIVAIFAFGQFLEGNVLVPRIVGNSVRLHPVWLLFAVSTFGVLFGFSGMLIAVPMAASIGVLVRFGLESYKASRLYDSDPPEGTAKDDEERG